MTRQSFRPDSLHIFNSPELFPLHIDLQRRQIDFVRMSRENYRTTVFLDHRIQAASGYVFSFNIGDLLNSTNEPYAVANTASYILHPAFSCSTLLTRLLEVIPHCLVLREPQLLTELANATYREAMSTSWENLITLAGRLFSRAYEPGASVIIKLNDSCNRLGATLLRLAPKAQVLFLAVPLRVFLLSVLKSPDRRNWLRHRLRIAVEDALTCPALARIETSLLSDAEAGAYVWATNEAIRRSLLEFDPDRVLSIQSEAIAENPAAVVALAAGHFRLTLPPGILVRISRDPSRNRHAKNPSLSFGSGPRRTLLKTLEESFGVEADRGVAWARDVLGETDYRKC